MTGDCIFCKIVAGEMPGEPIAENEGFIAIKDINPQAATHLLIIPKVHADTLDDYVAAGHSSEEFIRFATDVANQVGVAGNYRLQVNVGPDAGQIIFHLHAHLLSNQKAAD